MLKQRERLRVLELSHAIAGPTACQILADYGAEVIKIERPEGGDIFRDAPSMGPSMFLAVNRGKKSVVLDLKSSKGLKMFYALLKRSDVLVENLSPGSAENLGVTFARARRTNPGIVFCKIESFGSSGPMKDIPAFDPVLQAATGIMSTTGFPPDRFARAGVSIVDMPTGMHAAIAILFMLLERTKTGKGGHIEVSLYDAAAYYMSYWVARFDLFGKDTKPLGSSHVYGCPYNLFRMKDGHVYIAVVSDKDWVSFCKALGFEDLLAKEEFSLNAGRVERKLELEEEVAKRLAKMNTNSVLRALRNAKIPFSKLNTTKTLLNDPQFKSRKLTDQYTFNRKTFRTIVNPAIVERKRLHAKGNPPRLGQDTREVLMRILKLDKKEIQQLAADRIIKLDE